MAKEVKDPASGLITVSGKTRVSKFDEVLKKARALYQQAWDNRGIETKRKSIIKALEKCTNQAYTIDVFYRDFATRVNPLLDSGYFIKKCEEIGFDPFSVATHIVMMNGKKGIESLIIDRAYDGNDTIFKPFVEWDQPVISKDKLTPYLDAIDSDEESVQTTE